ncbi:MAG: glycosyltransferase family 4 protein [Erythrobacter sp.]
MLKLAASLVDQMICVSDAQREWMREEVGISDYLLQTIYPWSGRFELGNVPALKPRTRRPLRLLAYGRFAKEKNFDALVTAMRYFAAENVELTIFGDGPDKATLIDLAAPLPHVKIDEPTNDISAYLANCDAVIVPSRNEAFGLVATEARLAGRSIIVADVDGLPEQVGSAGIVVPLVNPEDIAIAIRWALRAPLSQMGQAGRNEVASQHDEIIAGWSTVFAQAAKSKRHAVADQSGSMVA